MRISSSTHLLWWPYGLLLLVVAGLYGQSLGFGYVWDDRALFLESTLLREGSWSWAAVARPILPDTPYFRPLVLSTWMAEMQLFELTPLYSHAVNVLLHGISTCLLFAIACRVFERYDGARTAALCAALLYTVHPCLAEGVAWISGRFDLLATALLLAGCSVALAPATVARCALVAVFALGAMLSKETGVLLAPFLVLLTFARYPAASIAAIFRGLWPYLLASAVATAVYFVLRSQGLGFASYAEFGLVQLMEAAIRYEVWLRTLSFYTFMAFMPFSDISPRHDLLAEMVSFRQHAAALGVSLLLLFAVVGFALKRHAWAVLWLGFYVGIFPVLGIFVINTGETIGSERFLYLPLTMLALALVALFLAIRQSYPRRRDILVLGASLGSGWLVMALFVTYTVTSMWDSDLRLWSWQYRTNPGNTLVRTAYLAALSKTQGVSAEKEFKEEIERIRNLHGGQLPLNVQIVYSGYLLEKRDPESMLYLQGLVENAYRMWSGLQSGESSQNDKITYYGVLTNYSQALMVFEGDLVNARKYLLQAQSLAPRGVEYQVVHQLIALNYLEGNKADALTLYRNHAGQLQAYNLRKMRGAMGTVVLYTCLRKQRAHCESYAKEFLDYLQEDAALTSR